LAVTTAVTVTVIRALSSPVAANPLSANPIEATRMKKNSTQALRLMFAPAGPI
jgi:hypothetical protein